MTEQITSTVTVDGLAVGIGVGDTVVVRGELGKVTHQYSINAISDTGLVRVTDELTTEDTEMGRAEIEEQLEDADEVQIIRWGE